MITNLGYRRITVEEHPRSPTGILVTKPAEMTREDAMAMLHAAVTNGCWGLGSQLSPNGNKTWVQDRGEIEVR